ncbi:MAG: A/G-specific adenine glycosylase [Verrucomicrobiota bacterium]|nr:A/G-specific adenine glycosylase [Verrucomicrobiota bacterium]
MWQANLISWFKEHQRDLPWRTKVRHPYCVWVSEIMLQQTTVTMVIPYFKKWMTSFPDVTALAAASEDTVLKHWEGLGYYSRARNLHKTAKLIVKNGGVFPNTPEGLLALPGIGPYTAGAIGSLAFNLPVPLVDGNVARVFTRFFEWDDDIKHPSTMKKLWKQAQKVLPKDKPGAFNEALMELGATVCTPKKPNCPGCPLVKKCKAFKSRRVSELPKSAPRKKTIKLLENALIHVKGEKTFILQNTQEYRALWQFPLGSVAPKSKPSFTTQYTFTHHRITLNAFEVNEPPIHKTGRWVTFEELKKVPLPVAHRRIAEFLLQQLQ